MTLSLFGIKVPSLPLVILRRLTESLDCWESVEYSLAPLAFNAIEMSGGSLGIRLPEEILRKQGVLSPFLNCEISDRLSIIPLGLKLSMIWWEGIFLKHSG